MANKLVKDFETYYDRISNSVKDMEERNKDLTPGYPNEEDAKFIDKIVNPKGEMIHGKLTSDDKQAEAPKHILNIVRNNGMSVGKGRTLYDKVLNALDGHGSNIVVNAENLGVSRDGYPAAIYNNQRELNALMEIAEYYGIDYRIDRINGFDRVIFEVRPDDYEGDWMDYDD